MDNNICTSVAELNISGGDLINAGCPKGEIIGKILNSLLNKVIDNPDLNKKDTLLDIAKTMF